MKETLKDKFNQIKTNVKEAASKITDADKAKIKTDVKSGNYSGAADTLKENFRKEGKV